MLVAERFIHIDLMDKTLGSFRLLNERYNLPDILIGKKVAPGGHRGVSDSVFDDPEHFVIRIRGPGA